MKSIFFSQIDFNKDEVAKLLQENPDKSSNKWLDIAKALKCDNIPYAWYIVKEEYSR